MRLGPLLRVLATLVYGFIGWELGVALAATRSLTSDSALYILPLTAIGLLLGYFLAPWLVIAPARAVRDSLRQVPIEDLIAGAVGLVMGLAIAALLTTPVSQIPPPFGTYLLRKNELLSLFGLQPPKQNSSLENTDSKTIINRETTSFKSHKLLLGFIRCYAP